MSEENDNTVVLVDDDGTEIEFEQLAAIEIEGNKYVVLKPVATNSVEDNFEDGDAEEVVILRLDYDENGVETYLSIDNEDELNKVFEKFKTIMKDKFEFLD